jgi:hypothetical protein
MRQQLKHDGKSDWVQALRHDISLLTYHQYFSSHLLVCNWLHSVGQNHIYVMLLFKQGCCFYLESSCRLCASRRFCADFKIEKLNTLHPSERPCQLSGLSSVKRHPSRRHGYSVRTPISVQKLRSVQGCICSDVSTTRLDAIQCSTSKRISFVYTDMGRQLQPSRRQVYTVQTLSLIRQDVEQICNRPEVKTTPSERLSLLWKCV